MSKKVDKDTRGNKWFYGSPHPPYVPLIDPSYKTPLKGESSKVTTEKRVECKDCDGYGYYAAPDGKGRPEQVRCQDCYGLGYVIVQVADKPPQSNLILDVIWAWLIKQGVEVSEEAKDELAKRIKEVLSD